MFCQHCGSELKVGAKFCSNCGAPISPYVQNSPPQVQNANPGNGQAYNNYYGGNQSTFFPVTTSPKRKRSRLWIGLIVLVLLVIVVNFLRSTLIKENGSVSSQTSDEETKQETFQKASGQFTVSKTPQNMKVGEIGKDKGFFVGLCCVRSLDYIQTALMDRKEEIPDDKEAIYVLLDVYNDSGKVKSFSTSNPSVYYDSVKAPETDSNFLESIDGYCEYNSYEMDSDTRALIVYSCIVEKGWHELSIFSNDLCWKVSPEDISKSPYKYASLYDLDLPKSLNEKGSIVYSGDYTIIFDNFEIYTHQNSFSDDTNYAVFELTVDNTSDKPLDYNLVGYNMRGYQDLTLLDGATYTMSDTIGKYINIYDVDEIKPGMTANVYVAFEITHTEGVFTCVYDAGYITNEVLGIINAK